MRLRRVAVIVALAATTAMGTTAAPASAADPCGKELRAFSKADRSMLKTKRAYRKAKTAKGKARLRKRLSARKRATKRAARTHDRCIKANPPRRPGLWVKPNPRINESILVDFMPESAPPSGTEYHIAIGVPTADTATATCGLLYVGTIDATRKGFQSKIRPTEALAGLFRPATYWCPGTAEVIVRLRAIGSTLTDVGVEQARVTILISAAAQD